MAKVIYSLKARCFEFALCKVTSLRARFWAHSRRGRMYLNEVSIVFETCSRRGQMKSFDALLARSNKVGEVFWTRSWRGRLGMTKLA
ncbi:hypothetical protein AgCh_036780 [Apium graveolens]